MLSLRQITQLSLRLKKNISGESLAFDFAFFFKYDYKLFVNSGNIDIYLQMSSEQLPFEKTHLIFNDIIGYIEMHQILLFDVN